MLSNLPNLFKNMTFKFQKASLHVEKTVINRLLDFSGVLYNFEINCTLYSSRHGISGITVNIPSKNVK
jgi:hypothetical protein